MNEYPRRRTKLAIQIGDAGDLAHTRLVPVAEQKIQAKLLRTFYKTNNIKPGDNFRVLLIDDL